MYLRGFDSSFYSDIEYCRVQQSQNVHVLLEKFYIIIYQLIAIKFMKQFNILTNHLTLTWFSLTQTDMTLH